jgi:Spy/CpxP family protein refolding chaperone
MIPTLTEAQKAKIYEWLKEAREVAMDAGSSDQKHAVFGKYKGRINNYLSAEGYDLKKATDEWQQRIKERNKSNQSK